MNETNSVPESTFVVSKSSECKWKCAKHSAGKTFILKPMFFKTIFRKLIAADFEINWICKSLHGQ